MSGVVAYRLRADLRRRWRAVMGLTVLVSLLGGVVIGTAAGARRTASAYDRLLAISAPPELLVSPPGEEDADPTPFYAELARLPGVRQIGLIAGIPLVPEAGTPSERLAEALGGIGAVASIDGSWGTDIARPRMVAGRLPDPSKADEILVSERFAATTDIAVGDHIDGVLLTEKETDLTGQSATRDQGTPVRLTVTGIGVAYDEVVPFNDLNSSGSILATGPLAELVDRSDWNFEGVFVDVEPGTDLAELITVIEALGNEDLGTGGPVFVSDQVAASRRVGDTMRPLAVALAVASVAIGLVALLVVGQAVSRASREASDEVGALRAAGLRPRDRVAFVLGRAAVVGTAGAVGAVVVAVGLSPRFPIGVARVAEPEPGLAFDWPVLAIGALATAALTAASVVPTALLGLRRQAALPAPSRLARAAASTGLSQAAVQGVRFAALDDRSRSIPVRSTLVAVTVAITSVVATVVFADSLVALIDTPSRYGQGWDRMVDAQFGPSPVSRVVERLGSAEGVRGIGGGNYGDVAIDGTPVPAFDLEVIEGEVSITIADGRPAQGPDEVVLGGETLDRLGVRVGDTVDVDTGSEVRPVRVTGEGVFPHMGQGSFSTTGLGVGAQFGKGGIPTYSDFFGEIPPDYEIDGRTYNFVAIDLEGSPSALDPELARLEASVAADGGFAFVRREQPPTKISDLDRVRIVPSMMAGVLAMVGVAALAHLLLTSVRERTRDLALLRTFGFSRRQLRAAVGWQSSVIAVSALVVGIPLGTAVGRAVWRWFADRLHAAAPAETPWAWLGIAVLGTLLASNLVALLPARRAARTHPAVTLREK